MAHVVGGVLNSLWVAMPPSLVSASAAVCETGLPIALALVVAWLGWHVLSWLAQRARGTAVAARLRARADAKRAHRDAQRAAHATPAVSATLKDEILGCSAGEIASRCVRPVPAHRNLVRAVVIDSVMVCAHG